MRTPLTLAAIASLWLAGCSLMVDFDPDGQPCDDAGRCLDGFTCRDGRCFAGDGGPSTCSPSCGAGQVCHQGGCVACSVAEDRCVDGEDDDCDGLRDCADPDCVGQSCNDGNLCTSAESCQPDGQCGGGTSLDCSEPPSDCFSATGSCDPATGACVYTPLGAGTSCDDGNDCTGKDACDGTGYCNTGSAVSCGTPPGSCYQPQGTCSPGAGCVYTPLTAGSPCDDGNSCTTGESCDGAGLCAGGQGVSCLNPPGTCFQKQGACDPSTKLCNYLPLPVGTSCSDGNACTQGDTCDGKGGCNPGPGCTTTNPCKTASCASGACVLSNKANGTSCGTAASKRCCAGSCVDISSNANHCGGCNSSCASGFACESVSVTNSCSPSPANTTGRCRCTGSAQCPRNQVCTTNQTWTLRCAPPAASNCGPNQVFHDLPTCPNYCSY